MDERRYGEADASVYPCQERDVGEEERKPISPSLSPSSSPLKFSLTAVVVARQT